MALRALLCGAYEDANRVCALSTMHVGSSRQPVVWPAVNSVDGTVAVLPCPLSRCVPGAAGMWMRGLLAAPA